MIATPLAVFLPQGQGRVYAAPYDEAQVDEQVASYIYIRAVARCIKDSGLRDGAANTRVDRGHAESWEWFQNTGVTSLTGSTETYLGYLDDKDESGGNRASGKKDCDNDNWLANAYGIWNLGGDTYADEEPGIVAICYSGFERDSADGNRPAEECIRGTGDFKRNDESTRLADFIRNVNKWYYGKEDSTELPTMTDAMRYYYYSRSFLGLCDAKERSNPEDYSDSEIASNNHLFKMLSDDGESYKVYETGDKDAEDHVSTRANNDYGQVELKCGYLVDQANKYAPAYAAASNTESSGIDTPGLGSGEEIGLNCAGFSFTNFISLEWIICPTIQGLMNLASELEDRIAGELCVSEADIFGAQATCPDSTGGSDSSSEAFYKAWSIFRAIALGLLVIGGLVMILSQGLGFEIFDAYTVKRTLPRLLIAAIAITLSWPLMQFLVTFSNVLGLGVRGIIYAPFQGMGHADIMTGTSSALTALFAAGAYVSLGALGLLSFIATAALAILIAFFVIIIRNILLVFLILIAPVAIALYILPNTEKYFKGWWSLFTKVLIVFPIITGMIALGHVFAAITFNKGDSLLETIVAFMAYFAPYFLIPAAFRFAGGALATIGGFANDRSRGGFDRIKRFRSGQSEKRIGHYGGIASNALLQQRYKAYKSLDGKKNPAAWAARRAIGGFNIESEVSASNAKFGKMLSDQTATGPDGLVRAYTVDKKSATIANGRMRMGSNGAEYRTLGGAWVSETQVDEANRAFGSNNHAAFQQALTYEMGKALTQEQQDGLLTNYAEVAQGRFGMDNSQLSEVWIGSAYAKQNENRQWKHYKWKDEGGTSSYGLNGLAMMQEIDEKQGNYAMMQQNADTWTSMSQEMIKARQVINGEVAGDRSKAEETLQRGARIAAATRSGSFEGVQVPGEDGAPTQQRTGGSRSVGAGAPGRVMQEMDSFVKIAEREAGAEYGYRPVHDGPGGNPGPSGSLPPTPEQGLNQRDRNR